MKKICILKGSPRKQGNTNALVSILAKNLRESGCEVAEFELYDMSIKPCVACRRCQEDWSSVKCVQNDDMKLIFDAVLQSELIILATPIYSWYCTPPMKAALDRLVYAMNMYYGNKKGPSLWAGKSVGVITTCGYPPERGADIFEEGIRRYCKHSRLNYMGMLCERHKGYGTVFMDDEKREHTLEYAANILNSRE